jgi:phage host-nuclease inhibitor protein Gam
MAGRPKKPTRELLTREDANGAIRDLLLATVELEKQQGALDLARAQATSEFEAVIDRYKSTIADIETQLAAWFVVHEAELTGGKRKSVELAYGVIGQRLGNPALVPLNRSWSWASITTKLKITYGVRFFADPPPPQPDKDLIRAELDADQLKACGLKVEQKERFFVELDRSSLAGDQ